MRHSILSSTSLVLLALALGACGGPGHAPTEQQFTQTNLRARGNQLTSINEWRGATVLPICTPVQVTVARGRQIHFSTGAENYRFVLYRRTEVPVEAQLARYFGPTCPKVDSLTPTDQMGIRQALPAVGMTRQGVIMALGYPPDHETPTLEDDEWTFWGSSGRVTVQFDGQYVKSIDGLGDAGAVPAGATGMVQVQTPGSTGGTPVTPVSNGGQGGSTLEIVEHGEGGAATVVE